MDKKAKKILFDTYWSSSGWKMGEERNVAPEDLAYAKEKGLMFDPLSISHDDCVEQIVKISGEISFDRVVTAFLSSLSTRQLDWRSAVASYFLAKSFQKHNYAPVESGCSYEDGKKSSVSYTCGICRALRYGVIGNEYYENEDLNVLNFERIKWGGVRHGDIIYTLFDLQQFEQETIPEPTPRDIDIFHKILGAIDSCDASDTPRALSNKLAMIKELKSNKAERDTLVEILACIGILKPKSLDRNEPGRHDWVYSTYWRGEDGYDKEFVKKQFGNYAVCNGTLEK